MLGQLKLFFCCWKTRIIVLFLLTNITLCVHAQPTVIRMDPGQPTGTTVSKLFSSVNYIPLETTKQSTFGRIDELCVTDSFYVILDNSTNYIFLFRRNGRFHTKISGGARNQYGSGAKNLAVNPDNRTIFFQDSEFRTHLYDMNGRKISSYKDSLNFRDAVFLRNNYAVYHTRIYNTKKNDTLDYEVKVLNNGKASDYYIPYQPNSKIISAEDMLGSSEGSLFTGETDSIVYFVRPYTYDVISVSPHQATEAYRFVFPANRSLPKDFLTNSAFYGKRFKYVNSEGKEMVRLIGSFRKVKHLLFFKLWCDGLRSPSLGNFIYDLKNQQVIAGEFLRPDSLNYFLPLTMGSMFATSHYMMHGFLATDKNAVYGALSSREMFEGKNAVAHKNQQFPAELIKYFSTSSVESNPIIIQLNLK